MLRNSVSARIKYFFIFCITALVLVPLVMPDSAFALQAISGNQISIQEPIQDEVLIFGETVSIDAPVKGAIIFANIIHVNAPIEGDLLAAGRQVTVNADVSGKIVAAGNTIDLGGKSTNAILAANNIHFDPTSVVTKDAYVAGGTITNEGNISGQLVAMTDNFQNNGTIGDLEVRSPDSMMPDIEGWLNLFGILFVIGFGILGIILVKLLPNQFDSVRLVMKKSIIKNTVVGFLLIILFVVVIVPIGNHCGRYTSLSFWFIGSSHWVNLLIFNGIVCYRKKNPRVIGAKAVVRRYQQYFFFFNWICHTQSFVRSSYSLLWSNSPSDRD